MSRFEQTSVADVGRWAGRYLPYLALVVVVALVVVFTPGRDRRTDDVSATGGAGGTIAGTGRTGDAGTGTSPAATGDVQATGAPTAGGGVDAAGNGGGSAAEVVDARPLESTTGLVDNCDPATGRIKVPSKGAAFCVNAFDGDNGGGSYQGVTGDTIKIVVYRGQANQTSEAILTAAGANDSDEQIEQQYQEWVDYYQHHYETYGRKVELVFYHGTGAATDDAAARADALKVAEMQPFASLTSPNNTYTDEMAARRIICISCATAFPAEYYLERAPYIWDISMSSTWGVIHGVERIEKSMWGRPAEFAGDPLMHTQTRKLGSLHYDTPDGAYKQAFDFFVSEMRKRGMSLTAEASFYGYPDLTGLQEKVRPLIQKMKEAGVTTVLLASDPFAPIFFTQEATRQRYFPEWSITGPLVDTAFFSRLYDQQQMRAQHTTGGIAARLPEELSDSYRLHEWHHGRPPTAQAGYALIRIPIGILFSGIHYAGDVLTPETFKNGMFNVPVTSGGPTRAAISYGNRLWPADDYTGADDVTYIWWDPDAQGEDETGQQGVGLYRYVNGGKRYLPGEHPTEVPWFVEDGTVTIYEDYPPEDRPPDYPPPQR